MINNRIMLIIKNIIINSKCPLCIDRYKQYIFFMKKFNKKFKKNNIEKLLRLLRSKKYINFYIDYLKCFKRFFPKKYKKIVIKINKIKKKINKKNPLYKFFYIIKKYIN